MGTDTSDGTIKLQDSWKNNPNRDMNMLNVLDVNFDLNKLAPLFSDINGSSTIVLHNLGGCCMGKDRNSGVVDNFGRVYNGAGATLTDYYTDFYVADGAVVPTSLGVNSSLTISALAFRIAEKIVDNLTDLLPVEPATIDGKIIYFSK